MVYRLLGSAVAGGAYHKIQNVSCASAKIILNNETSAQAKKYPKIMKWVKYNVYRTTLTLLQ